MLKTQTYWPRSPQPPKMSFEASSTPKNKLDQATPELLSNPSVQGLRRFHKVIFSKMLPHFLIVLQWALLVITIILNLNFTVVVTEAAALGGLKTIMFSHVWIPFLSVVLCLAFFRLRKEGSAEKAIIIVSMMTILLSFVNIFLRFVDDMVFLMKTAELASWGLYNVMFSISVGKILIGRIEPKNLIENLRKEEEADDEGQLWR